jgi:hypothetical protein
LSPLILSKSFSFFSLSKGIKFILAEALDKIFPEAAWGPKALVLGLWGSPCAQTVNSKNLCTPTQKKIYWLQFGGVRFFCVSNF